MDSGRNCKAAIRPMMAGDTNRKMLATLSATKIAAPTLRKWAKILTCFFNKSDKK